MTKQEQAYKLFLEREQLSISIQNAQARIQQINQELTKLIAEIEKEDKKK